MINLRFRKDFHILVVVLKREVEHVVTQEETQVKEEPLPTTVQCNNESNHAATTIELSDSTPAVEETAILVQNMLKEKQYVQPVSVQ